MLKALNENNKLYLFNFIKDWWMNDDVNYKEWKASRLVPLHKKGDTRDLDNWRGINLFDVCSKVVSIILHVRSKKLLESNGLPIQFGATPKVGCSEAIFSLKTLFQNRREMGHGTHAVFVDLVKTHDSVRHDVIVLVLRKMGAPEQHVKWIKSYMLILRLC